MDIVNRDYLKKVLEKNLEFSSVLEVGSQNINGNCKELIRSKGYNYFGIDISSGPDVDAIVDITTDFNEISKIVEQKFDFIICMNVLEHVYEPIKALQNLARLIESGGYITIVVPLVWDLHSYPCDFYRLCPDFFIESAKRNNLEILEDLFIFSDRDTKQFYSDMSKIPLSHEVNKNGKLSSFLAFIEKIVRPSLLNKWNHTYLNVTLRKI
jgi:SAM-dependent methyltransferase